jgi:predicted dehydrogenase
MKNRILSPLEASHRGANESNFTTAYPLREWALVNKLKQMIQDNTCGELCSLRFTWQKPKKEASDENAFLYETLAGILDVAWLLADSELKSLHIERVNNMNNLLALATFKNNVVAEIEINECLPDSMPATHFIKANFKHGHITNQPIVGHFNEEGSILANDSGLQRLVMENSEWNDCGDEMEICQRRMLHAIDNGKFPSGPLNSKKIINAIQGAC